MRKHNKIYLTGILIIFTLCLFGCQQDKTDLSDNSGVKTAFADFGGVFEAFDKYIYSQLEAKAAEASSTSPEKETDSLRNTDMTGVPDPIDTLTSDDGNKLVLVNKLHAVSKDYYPIDMVPVDGSLSTNQGLYFKREAYEAYLKMLADAQAEGLDFLICSAYRSYSLQTSLYNTSMAQYGAAFTNTRSAYPGRSEHHTGWAVDITSKSMGYGLSQDFVNYPEGLWINNHCSEYGFIIRYPKGKTHITGYDYEPWHLRYVGVEAAKEITSKGITLEQYL